MAGEVVAIIPARYGSTRFPGKPLASDTGRPLIQHVYEQAQAARRISRVIVATDDARIEAAVRSFGGDVMMTRADHVNGTSRIAEVAESLASDVELVVNVQGDEPELNPEHIDAAVETLQRAPDEVVISTLAAPFASDEAATDPNIVKVVIDQRGRALYFSRSLIPHDREHLRLVDPLKHVGLYVYRRAFLPRYISLPETPLEQSERLEQLRVLEHGYAIAVALVDRATHGIDTPEQYQEFVARWRRSAEE